MKWKNTVCNYEEYAEEIISKLALTEKLEKEAIVSNFKNLLIETEEKTRAYTIKRLDAALLLFKQNLQYYRGQEGVYNASQSMLPALIELISSDVTNVFVNDPPSEQLLKPMLLRDDGAILNDLMENQEDAWWLVSTDEGYLKYETIINKAIKEIKKKTNPMSLTSNQKKQEKTSEGVEI